MWDTTISGHTASCFQDLNWVFLKHAFSPIVLIKMCLQHSRTDILDWISEWHTRNSCTDLKSLHLKSYRWRTQAQRNLTSLLKSSWKVTIGYYNPKASSSQMTWISESHGILCIQIPRPHLWVIPWVDCGWSSSTVLYVLFVACFYFLGGLQPRNALFLEAREDVHGL